LCFLSLFPRSLQRQLSN